MSINRVTISGNVGSDPQLRATQSGMSVLSFSVAVNERVKDASGNWSDRPNWVDCTMFGARAEKLGQYLTKGAKVAIEGRLRYSSWEKDGQRRSKLDVIVDEIEFMSSRRNGAQAAQAPQAGGFPQQAPAAPQSAGYAPQDSLYDEAIPF